MTIPIADLAGTTLDCTVTVHEIKRRVVPALDDEFAKDLGEFESLDALRARVRADLEAEATESADRQVRSDLMKKLAERVPFAVPPTLIDHEVERRMQDFARRLMDQRIDPRQTNIDWAAFRQAQQEPATESVKSAMALDEIAQARGAGGHRRGHRRRTRPLRRRHGPLGGLDPGAPRAGRRAAPAGGRPPARKGRRLGLG